MKLLRYLALALAALGVLGMIAYRELFPVLPKTPLYGKIEWLDQGWTSQQREQYYRAPQGSLIIPYSWFFALEQPTIHHPPFAEESNLLRYDLVPDAVSEYNPDALPVGFTRQTLADDSLETLGCGAPPCSRNAPVHKEWLSYTCAACHTAVLTFHGKSIGVDGGRGRWNFTLFNTTLANLLVLTSLNPFAFDRFAGKVLKAEGRPDILDERNFVRKELQEFLRGPSIKNGIEATFHRTYPTEEGFGRSDALGRSANGQFAPLDRRNILVANAPVLFPPLWYTHDFGWVQSIAAIRQPLGRNITQSWGVKSAVNLADADPSRQFMTSIQIDHLFWMETLISVMTPPKWPAETFGKPEPEAVALGKYLFEEKIFDHAPAPEEEQWCPEASGEPCPNPNQPRKGLCSRCHAPALEVHPNAHGKRYLQLPLYKLDVIGTDPMDAVNFNRRQVYTGPFKSAYGGKEKLGVGEALLISTTRIMEREFPHQHIAMEDRDVVAGFRENRFRAPLAYPARPLNGYWAAPPYLHNGGVPDVYSLLSPVEERPTTFWTGNPEYDPVKLGYRSERFEGGFQFQSRRSVPGAIGNAFLELLAGKGWRYQRNVDGNSNGGHEFRQAPKATKGVIGPYLTPRERYAIIEYLKAMPELAPLDRGEELTRRKELLDDMAKQYGGLAR